MRLGFGQLTLQRPPWDTRDHATIYGDALDLFVLAEQVGFDSVWLAEHHGASDGYNPSTLPMLAAAAARTSTIELGTAVLLAPFHDPLRIAEDAAVVDLISRGRLNLGLGLGWAPEEYRMFGVDSARRGKRMEEIIAVLRGAWDPGRFTVDGDFYNLDDVSVMPKPHRPIPIYLGGGVEAAIKRAVRLGDGYFPASTSGGPDALADIARHVKALRDEVSDEPFRFGMFVPIGLGDDADDGWSKIRDGVMHVRGSYMLLAQNERDLSGARDVVAPYEDAIRATCITGSAVEIRDQLARLAEEIDGLGFADTFLSAGLVLPGMGTDGGRAAVERFGAEVLHKLQN